ncbi:ATP synthase F1 subunit gamma [Candidatus Kaiserbacteria bacterium]|nr:ATP synthase F1 subunit gamma [Candidatus Kaiserbacteria bacterium]
MANLKSIKSKILSYKKTGTVTHAMEAVSAVKMRKSQGRALSTRAYARAALRILSHIAGSIDVQRHPLVHKDPSKDITCIVLVTSDKGLAGSLNAAVIRKVLEFIKEHNLSPKTLEFICLGRRGYEFAQRNGYRVLHHMTNITDGVSELEVRDITGRITELQTSGDARKVYMAYTNFCSTFEQEPIMRQILPLRRQIIQEIVDGIVPEKGKYAAIATREGKHANGEGPAAYTMEPDAASVLAEVLPKLANVAVFHALLETKASEHSARMVAMKSATDKAKEMASSLTRTFNKVRQASITREVSEITSGIEAMK